MRGDDEFMNGLPAALLRLFQTTRKQLDAFFPSRYPFRFYNTVDIAVVVSRNRLLGLVLVESSIAAKKLKAGRVTCP